MHACLTRESLNAIIPTLRKTLEAHAATMVGYDDAADAVQDALVYAYQKFHCFRPETGRQGLLLWLKEILTRICHCRLSDRNEREDMLSLDEALAFYDTPDSLGSEDQLLSHVRDYLLRHLPRLNLTERQYDCLVRRLHGYSEPEIGRDLGLRHQTVSLHIQAAIAKAKRDRTLQYWVRFFIWVSRVTVYRAPAAKVWNTKKHSVEWGRWRSVKLEAFDEENVHFQKWRVTG
jgi:RNA polymerase sigma factor (sigma-70 family)